MVQSTQTTQVNFKLAQVLRSEIGKYAGPSDTSQLYPVFDRENHRYCVITIHHQSPHLTPRVVVMARIKANKIIIEEDTTDKPLVDALMVNASIPREQIILAYAGESLSEEEAKNHLLEIVQREVAAYSGLTYKATTHYIEDAKRQVYMVVIVPDNNHPTNKHAAIVVMARVEGDKIIIEEDTTDKPLVDALMVNANVPREQIILAYAGEKLPEANTEE